MRLQRVKIFGFKTFADKAEFDIDGDLIAVVGPNGCGKSNLVDAILWALGEGNARQLRAQTGQDVIFSGSSKRKPVGYAEVTLLFDNEDGSLPIETPEVSITRRLNRSGDSEYMINRRNCRLRDIVELLADTGLGRSGYAIVGQKDIDQALAASPEERRGWIDEAAGVQRYRARKIESLRRLAQAQQHLDRVTDIISEIETQREPLREEAEIARRYKSILNSLREVESGLLMVEIDKAIKEIAEHESRIKDSLALVDAETNDADRIESEIKIKGDQISNLEAEMDRQRATQQALLTTVERTDAAIKLSQQKLISLTELEQNLGDEGQAAEQRLAEVAAEIEALIQEEKLEIENLERVRVDCSGAGEDAKALNLQLKQVERQLQEAREIETRRLKSIAEAEHRKTREKEVRRELDGIRKSLPDIESAATESQDAYQDIKQKSEEIELTIKSATEQIYSIRKEESDSGNALRKQLAERAALEGRIRGIEATIETHEGLHQGARAVLAAVEAGKIHGEYVPVGECIEVDRDHAIAVETALGAASNDLIVEDETAAKIAIEFLKSNRLGRATFQPIPLMRPPEITTELRRLLNEKGVIDRASQLVQCASRHRPVIESLLGRVIIVEDIDTALRLAKTSGWNRLVTLDGEVVHHSGAVSGGVHSKSGYGVVQRKADLAELGRELSRLIDQIESLEKSGSKRLLKISELEQVILVEREKYRAMEAELVDARQWNQSVSDEFQSTKRSLAKLEAELEALIKTDQEVIQVSNLEGIEQERDLLVKQLASRSADAEQAEQKLHEAMQRAEQAQIRLAMARRRQQNALSAEEGRTRRSANLDPERQRAQADIEKYSKEKEKASLDLKDISEQLSKSQETRKLWLDESYVLSEQAKEKRGNVQLCRDTAHQAELNRARSDSKRAAHQQRLMEEYGLTEEDAIMQAANIELPSDAYTVVSKLRREMKSMGDVNIGAIEAFERLNERYEELANQCDDIQSGIREVESSIRELDSLTRDKFTSTFEKVQSTFSELFPKLFPGGSGTISLTDPTNLLESGIEIDVQLPGKNRQRLELLSGGERSLCATAFLFSLLRVKPSPLVVLDEVDAPLDGRNVERYIDLLREFSLSTQFIIITHNPTTIAAAPVWLGVTMQEPGVSTLIPTKVSRTERDELLDKSRADQHGDIALA